MTSAGSGNRAAAFSLTFVPSTQTVNSPELPTVSVASTFKAFFSSAATRAALGL